MDPAGGRQPLETREGDWAIVVNGMIYNDLALRDALGRERYQTGSDSESVLHGLAVRGEALCADLDGMFAFVGVDSNRIVAARDPLGIKPLYYGTAASGTIYFASEAKALLGLVDTINPFPAGHVATISGTGEEPRPERYYEIPPVAPEPMSTGDAAREIRTTLEAAVRKRLRSDVPLGCFLSGGLDSSIIAALARQELSELHTFSVGLPGAPDLAAARRVAEHIGSIHHEHVIEPDEVHRVLPKLLWHLESFDRDLVRSAVPTWFVSKVASDRVKVVLTGEGADELFAGYTFHKRIGPTAALASELRRGLDAMQGVNLQRVDRMTMAHGLEARVPFLDRSMIALAQRIPIEQRLRAQDGQLIEKWILRVAVDDLLPAEIVWRDKAQFDEGSGLADYLQAVVRPTEHSRRPEGVECRSDEEWLYAEMLAEQFTDPTPILRAVKHWVGSEELS